MNQQELKNKKNEFHKRNRDNINKYIVEQNKKFEEMKLKFKNYKFNYIYFLQVSVEYYKNCYSTINRGGSYVYSTMDKALEEGKKYLNLYFNEVIENNNLLEVYGYDNFSKDQIIRQEMKTKNLHYSFSIEKMDPYYKDNFIKPEGPERMVIGVEPSSTEFIFNYKGKEQYRKVIYSESRYGKAFENEIYPGDENLNAGTKFKIGDLVYDMNWTPDHYEKEKDRPIIMIRVTPDKSENQFFTNTYGGIGIDSKGTLWPYYGHLHGSKLKLYKKAKDIPEGSVWKFVRQLVDHYDEIKQETWDKIMKGEINFLETPSFRDINIKDCMKKTKEYNSKFFVTKNPNLQQIYNIWNDAEIIGSISFSEENNDTAVVEFYKNYKEMDCEENYLRKLSIRDIGYHKEFYGKAYEVIVENNLCNYEQIYKNSNWYNAEFEEKSKVLIERSKLKYFFEKQYEEVRHYMNYEEENEDE